MSKNNVLEMYREFVKLQEQPFDRNKIIKQRKSEKEYKRHTKNINEEYNRKENKKVSRAKVEKLE